MTRTPNPPPASSAASFARSEFFGMWRNRTEIVNSAEFAATLRREGWRRSHALPFISDNGAEDGTSQSS